MLALKDIFIWSLIFSPIFNSRVSPPVNTSIDEGSVEFTCVYIGTLNFMHTLCKAPHTFPNIAIFSGEYRLLLSLHKILQRPFKIPIVRSTIHLAFAWIWLKCVSADPSAATAYGIIHHGSVG